MIKSAIVKKETCQKIILLFSNRI